MTVKIKPAFKQQWQVLRSKSRFILATSGIQGGKTTIGGMWMADQISKRGLDRNYLIAAPTYKILQQSTLPKFFELLGNDLSELGVFHKQDSEIIFRDGKGRIFIRSCESPDLLEGMTIDGVAWLDEAGQMAKRVWINIQGRTAIAQSPVLFTTTPYNMGWIYQDVRKRWQQGDRNYDVITWKSIDNPYFPKEEYYRAQSTMNESDFARRYNAEWRQLSGLVYPDFDIEKHVIPPMDLPQGWQHFCGVDFGFTNPTAVVYVCRDNDANYYIYDEYYEKGKTAPEHIPEVRKKIGNRFIKGYYCDPTAREEIQDWINGGLRNIFGGKTNRGQGIRKVTEFIKAGKLKVFNRCINLIDEFQNYRIAQPKEDRNFAEEPLKNNDHLLDALRYCVINTSWSDHPLMPKAETIETPDGTFTRPRDGNVKDTLDNFIRKQQLEPKSKDSAFIDLSSNLVGEHR